MSPLPSVAAFAERRGIPLAGIALASEGGAPREGDAVTLLVTLSTGGRYRQWLAVVQADKLSARERESRPPIGDVVRYTTTGSELRYHVTATAALRITFIGPFIDDSVEKGVVISEENERVLVSPEFLGLGLDQTCRIWVRLQDQLKQLRTARGDREDLFLPLESSTTRFPDSIVEKTRSAAARINFTPDDERPFYGMELALEAFARIIESTPATESILQEVVEKPSFWSTLTHLGLDGNITATPQDIGVINPDPWSSGLPAYRLPFTFSLNGQPALEGVLAVTAPRSPLLACAGILGIDVTPPHHPGKRLLVRVVATRQGSGAPLASSVGAAP